MSDEEMKALGYGHANRLGEDIDAPISLSPADVERLAEVAAKEFWQTSMTIPYPQKFEDLSPGERNGWRAVVRAVLAASGRPTTSPITDEAAGEVWDGAPREVGEVNWQVLADNLKQEFVRDLARHVLAAGDQ